MVQKTRYNVLVHAPKQIKLQDYGITPDEMNRPYAATLIEGDFTQEEFQAIFGEEAKIARGMFVEGFDGNNYTRKLFAHDVLAEEHITASHQMTLVNHLLKGQGKNPLEYEKMLTRARTCEDIKPEALNILLDAAAQYPNPFKMDPANAEREMREAGLTLDDLLRPEEE